MDKTTFSIKWILQGEHGRFFQAIATGIYKDYGLDVSIKRGHSQVPSGNQLLMRNIVNLFMGYGIDVVNTIAAGILKITTASHLLKRLQCLIAHPNTAIKTLTRQSAS